MKDYTNYFLIHQFKIFTVGILLAKPANLKNPLCIYRCSVCFDKVRIAVRLARFYLYK